MENKRVKRGEIYLYDFGDNHGSVQNGIRPVLVVQCDAGNQVSPTTVIAAITTANKKRYLPSHVFLNDNFGLREPSMVMLEQLKTVNQQELTHYIGTVDSEYVQRQLNNGLKKAVGLWIERAPKPEVAKNTRCLCRRCLNDYIDSNAYIVKRLDPFSAEKGSCDRCGAPGWDYIVYEKKKGAN